MWKDLILINSKEYKVYRIPDCIILRNTLTYETISNILQVTIIGTTFSFDRDQFYILNGLNCIY